MRKVVREWLNMIGLDNLQPFQMDQSLQDQDRGVVGMGIVVVGRK